MPYSAAATAFLRAYKDVIDFAMEREEEEHRFYLTLARRAATPELARRMRLHAEEESAHKKMLVKLLADYGIQPDESGELPMGMAGPDDYRLEGEGTHEGPMSAREEYLLAMRMERSNRRLYEDLARQAENDLLRETFTLLAEQEARHLVVLEAELDGIA